MKELNDILSSVGKLYTDKGVLAAIWLEKPVKTSEGKKVRICPDCLVWVKDGSLVDGEGEPTHKVIECRGTLVSLFEMDLQNLITNELITIKL